MKKRVHRSRKPTIGVIIVHYGSVSDTKECLLSLKNLQSGPYTVHVYLIDNDPAHRLPRRLFPKELSVRLIISPSNRGFAAGINLGMRQALQDKREYLFFLNNDTVVHPTLFTRMLPCFSQDLQLGLLSPLLVYYDNPERIWCTSGKINTRFLYTTYPYMNRKLSDVVLPEIIYSDFGAAALLVKAEVCNAIGFMDEKYFLFGEDVEWCLRAKQNRYRLAYITEPLVRHKVSAGSGEKGTNLLTPRGSYLYARNFFYILGDHREWFNLFFALCGQFCIRAPFYLFFRTQSFGSRVAYLRGLYAGLRYLFTGKSISSQYTKG